MGPERKSNFACGTLGRLVLPFRRHSPMMPWSGIQSITIMISPICKLFDLMNHCNILNFSDAIPEEAFSPTGMRTNWIGQAVAKARQRFPDADRYKTNRQYHTTSQGLILNELFRRLDPQGRTIGQVLREDISHPLGVDVHFGLTDEEVKRVAKCQARLVFFSKYLLHFTLEMKQFYSLAIGFGFCCSTWCPEFWVLLLRETPWEL